LTVRHDRFLKLVCLIVCCGWCDVTVALDWPQWRGPTRDGLLPEGNAGGPAWPAKLDGGTLKKAWSVPLGPSYSGPIVVEDRVFTTETHKKSEEVVRAYRRSDGQPLWEHRWEGSLSVPFFAKENGDWIRSTPAYDRDTDGTERLFVAGIRDVLVCVDAATGKELWKVDCVERFKSALPAFGCASSPLVYGDAVYLQAGGGFVKFDKRTGATTWRVLDDGGGMNGSAFSSPYLTTELAGSPLLLVQGREKLSAVDPVDGRVRWSQAIDAFRGMNILTPVVFGGGVFTSSYGGKAWLYKVRGEGETTPPKLEPAWTHKSQAYMSSPVVIDGHAYVQLRSRRFQCLDLATGKETWTTEPFGRYWSLVARGKRILALDERGELLLIDANPGEFKVLDKRKVSDAEAWAHLAVAGEDVVIRDLKHLTLWKWRGE
jgi:outer membrane protein assembly factor BamB